MLEQQEVALAAIDLAAETRSQSLPLIVVAERVA
jgi:hypothetical protein